MTTTNNFIAINTEAFNFHISKYQVTMKEYLAFVNETNTHYPEWMQEGSTYNIKTGSDDLYEEVNFEDNAPVVGISWEDAKAYCTWRSEKENINYRLPTEREWEYACRANTTTSYSCKDEEISKHAWYFDNSLGEAHSVGTKKPNPLGLNDMHGNVWEWCEDIWQETYTENPNSEEVISTNSSEDRRVLRGGSWFDMKENASSSSRHKYALDFRYVDVGFRILWSA